MKREGVYELIDGERDYQDSKPARPKSDNKTAVGEWLIYMKYQLDNAMTYVYLLDEKRAMEYVRKLAALAVACMEYNETPPRES